MTENAIPPGYVGLAVLYAAKSTEDTKGSIQTQLEDGRALGKRERLWVVGEYWDEAKTAFHGNRGSELARARDHAQRVGATIIVQHSDRLARGDGVTADHLVELVLWARKAGVRCASVQDPQTFDGMGLVYAALMGDRNHDDSARKSAAVKDGLRRRKERGKPVGPVPLGYVAATKMVDGDAVTQRVVCPTERATVDRIFDLIEAGASPGATGRTLNAEGRLTKATKGKPGKAWTPIAVRRIIRNDDYAGRNGYTEIIEPGRWQAINDSLTRMDPAAVQRRKGGRKPVDASYFLRGIAFCRSCGGTLYTRTQAAGRMYVCRNRRQGTGLCNAPPIPAEVIEGHVLSHLDMFVGSVEAWLGERVKERSTEHQARIAAVERQTRALDALDGQRERHLAEYRRLVDDGNPLARLALGEVERIDGEHEVQQQVIAEAEAVVSEWAGPPDLDAALDFYTELVHLVQGRIRQARGAAELNQALHQVIAGLWVDLDGDKLHAEFELRDPESGTQSHVPVGRWLQVATVPSLDWRRLSLPETAELGLSPSCRSNL